MGVWYDEKMFTSLRISVFRHSPVDTQVCLSYTLLTPWGWQTPDMDTKFNSARALSITGIVLGGAAWFTLILASCCKLDQGKLNGLSCYFFLATLFQGLSLLIFRSNVW